MRPRLLVWLFLLGAASAIAKPLPNAPFPSTLPQLEREGDGPGGERILGYHAEITLATDGSMMVTETIRVRAEGDQIKRGIYRDFPTTYRDPLGHRYRVDFGLVEATRDGQREPWHSELQGNGVRIYLGQEDVLLEPRVHDYRLTYRTQRQVGFFDDHDELYWNVTGNGWGFPIDAASAEIRLSTPVPATSLRAFGYTGPQDSREQALTAELRDSGAVFTATRPLAPGEGLSVVLEFPKGVVIEPSRQQKLVWLLRDNAALLVALAGLGLLWAYYAWAWRRFGRDPAAGVRMPVYEPPRGYSAASLRFIRRMGYDRACLAAALLGLAAKGWLDIDQDDKGVVTLRRTGRNADFGPGERALGETLLPGSRSELTLQQSSSNATLLQAAQKAHRQALAGDYERKYFHTHRDKLIPGLVLTVLTLLCMLFALPGEMAFGAGFISVWLSMWSVGVYALLSQAITASRGARGVMGGIGAAFIWLFALPFLLGEVAGLVMLGALVGAGPVLALAALAGTNVAFLHWMKAPTRDGARLLDAIEGFRWFLGVAEKQELDSRYQPESRPDLFSEYLPYAFALDVDQAWSQRFADALPAEVMEQHRPGWYHGSAWSAASLGGFTSSLSSGLSSSISSASSSPGSSSGSSGGSGGGGGGGGGGGW